MLGLTVMLVQGMLSMAACSWHAETFALYYFIAFFYRLHAALFLSCFLEEYDVSAMSWLRLVDMKCVKMYYRRIWLVVNFSQPDNYMLVFCLHSNITPISISLSCFQNSFSKTSLPRFLKSSLEIKTRGLYSRCPIAGNVTRSKLDPPSAESGYRTIAKSTA